MSRFALSRFVVGAVLLRSMDAGATVAFVLLASERLAGAGALRTAGAVGAALTAPHLLAPLTARLIDRARDPRRVVTAAGVTVAVLLVVAGGGLGQVSTLLVLGVAAVAGGLGPVLTGGLSSLLDTGTSDAGRKVGAQDALTYGLAGALAPGVVGVVAEALSPTAALVALCVGGALGAGLLARAGLIAPRASAPPRDQRAGGSATGGSGAGDSAAGGGQGRADVNTGALHRPSTWGLLRGDRQLRRAVALTWLGAFGVAAAVLTGMGVAEHGLGGAGWLAASFGVGSLLGGAILAVRPPRSSPVRGITWATVTLGGVVAGTVIVATAALRPGPRVVLLLGAFTALGVAQAAHTVFSLQARGAAAPGAGRSSLFVTVAGVKVAFSSAGTAAAGLVAACPPAFVLAVVALVLLGSSAPLLRQPARRAAGAGVLLEVAARRR